MQNKLISMLLAVMLISSVKAESVPEPQYPAMLDWEIAFHQSLLDSENPELQVYGLLFLSDRFWTEAHPSLLEQMRSVFKSITEYKSLSLKGGTILLSLCESKVFSMDCDLIQLMEQQLKQYPNDLSAYFYPLSKAMVLNIEGEVIDLVQRMASSTHFSNNMHYDPIFENALLAYLKDTPYTAAVLAEGLDDHLRWFHRDIDITDEQLASIKTAMPQNLLLMQKIISELKMPIFSYKGLLDACQTYAELTADCLKISAKMISSSNEYIDMMIGLAIPVKMYEAQGAVKKHEQALLRKDLKHTEMECVAALVEIKDIFGVNAPDMFERIEITREQGDRAGMIHHANVLYQRALEQGDENAEIINPETCLVE